MAAVRIKSNVSKQANSLGNMAGNFADDLSGRKLTALARRYEPLFAAATPKVSGKAANSITVEESRTGKNITVKMSWGTDYIDDVNRDEGKNQGFAENQFKSIANRLNTQAKIEIGNAFATAGKKNKLKVKR